MQASNYLLIHAPVKGKVVIQRLFELINEASFPADPEKAFTVLSSENNLGRARGSSIRNLSLILLKRVFRDENSISLDLLNRVSASLGAIERIAPEVYNEVMKNQLGTMLSATTDIQLMRIFPFLITRDIWSNIADAEKIRIEGLVRSISIQDLIKYKVTALAEINYQVKSELISVISQLGNAQKYALFSAHPSKVFKKEAID